MAEDDEENSLKCTFGGVLTVVFAITVLCVCNLHKQIAGWEQIILARAVGVEDSGFDLTRENCKCQVSFL